MYRVVVEITHLDSAQIRAFEVVNNIVTIIGVPRVHHGVIATVNGQNAMVARLSTTQRVKYCGRQQQTVLDDLDDLKLSPLGEGSPAVEIDGEALEGFPTPSKKLELYSSTLADWGWPEYATPKWIPSQVHWEDIDMAESDELRPPSALPSVEPRPHSPIVLSAPSPSRRFATAPAFRSSRRAAPAADGAESESAASASSGALSCIVFIAS